MHFSSLATSAEMAGELGPFPAYERNREAMLRVVRNHRRAAYARRRRRLRGADRSRRCRIDAAVLRAGAAQAAARDDADRMLELGEQHGYRNAQVTLIAPTGTIGLVMDCDTTGIEPDFALVKFKKLAGGGYFKIINASVPPALANLGYTPKQVDDIVRYCVGSGTLEGCPHINAREACGSSGSPTTSSRALEDALPRAFDVRFAFNRGSRSATRSAPSTSASTRSSSTSPASTCSRRSASPPTEIDEANAVRLRHDDRRGRPAPARPSTCRCSTAPTSAAGSARGPSARWRTSG